AFAVAAITTLALSIGATVAIFAVVNAVLLERLPVPQPERVVSLCEHNVVKAVAKCNVLNPGHFLSWQDHGRYFESVGAYFDRSVSVSSGTEPVSVETRLATAGMFT